MRGTNASTRQAGFTLIELVAVIVILGILAAVAIPKYSDLSTSTRAAVARSRSPRTAARRRPAR